MSVTRRYDVGITTARIFVESARKHWRNVRSCVETICKRGKVVGDPGIEPGVRLREGAAGGPCHLAVSRRIDPGDRSAATSTALAGSKCAKRRRGKWWATLESNQACVSAREPQAGPATWPYRAGSIRGIDRRPRAPRLRGRNRSRRGRESGGRPWNRTRRASPRGSYSPLPHLAACRPLSRHKSAGCGGLITAATGGRQQENRLRPDNRQCTEGAS